MEKNQVIILNYLLNNGKVMFPIIYSEHDSEMTRNEFSDCINKLSKFNLIKFDNQKLFVEITENGKIKLKEINSQIEQNIERTKTESLKINLEIINLNLENENLKYLKKIREKESEIRDLTSKNLKLQNREYRQKIIFSIFGFILAYLINNADKILILLDIKVPEWLK